MKVLTELILDNYKSDILTTADVVTLSKGSSDRRYGLVKRALAAEEIIQIRRGLYYLAKKYQRGPMNLFALAQRIYGPSYISFESALSYHGWIPEAVYLTASASIRKAIRYTTPLGIFDYKRIPCADFFYEVNRIQNEAEDIFFMASPIRALVDYIYVYKKDWPDLKAIAQDLRIEPENFNEIKKEALQGFKENFKSRRVKRFIKMLEGNV
ncbi:MAG: hypothetical protein H6755_01370 [Candidatus Omnitrophica bacterium]|nr:hypothetical protein [Candidatus Omnitrophota bacterium]